MNNLILAVEVSVPGINVALVDLNTHFVKPGTTVFEAVDTNDTAENLINAWSAAIQKCAQLNNLKVDKIACAAPGPCDYEKGISLMTNQNKFESLYQLNIKELLADKLNIPAENILMENNTLCLMIGELFSGCAQGGYNNVLAFALNRGFGSARYYEGKAEGLNLWNIPFKDGIAENYLGVGWITKRYQEFTGIGVADMEELVHYINNDDGIGEVVFNEYGENFVKLLIQQIGIYNPQLIILGGHTEIWKLFISHVKDRLIEKNIKIPLRVAALGNDATLIGAAHLWAQ